MGLKINSLIILLMVCAAYGQKDIWSDETEEVYETATTKRTPKVVKMFVPKCTVSGRQGDCVPSRLHCKTVFTGQETVTFRTSNVCKPQICCVVEDIIDPHPAGTGTGGTGTGGTGTGGTGTGGTGTGGTATSGTGTGGTGTGGTVVPGSDGTTFRPPVSGIPTTCGIRKSGVNFFKNNELIPKASFGEFPWTVAIYKVKDGVEEYCCVGSLIHPRVVLTVANRFDRGGQFRIRAGDWSLRSTREPRNREDREVESYIIHEEFSSGFGWYDVGLLFLNRDVNRNYHINYACLPKANHVTPPATTCIVTGWGKNTVDGNLSDTQKMLSLPVVDRNTCEKRLRIGFENKDYQLDSSMMCAGGNGVDTCQGDGGAPLVCPYMGSDAQFYQAGITSGGVACDKSYPSIYSDVAALKDWIDRKMTEKGYTTEYYTP